MDAHLAPATIDNKRLCYGLGFSSQKSGIEFFQYPETEKNGDAAVDDGISSTVLEDRQTHVNSHPIGPLQLRGDVTYWRARYPTQISCTSPLSSFCILDTLPSSRLRDLLATKGLLAQLSTMRKSRLNLENTKCRIMQMKRSPSSALRIQK
ncbi:hypothetical protein GQR58_011756 [Nymphon striatum]|nr:hypothetical protein GQR58_011756 [Nymphon striatum]